MSPCGFSLLCENAGLTLSCVLHRFSISLCRLARGESFHWLSLFFNSSTVLKWRDIPNWAHQKWNSPSVRMYACTCSVRGLLATCEYSACSLAKWTNGGCAVSRRNTQWGIWVLRTCGDLHLFMWRNKACHCKYINTKKPCLIYHLLAFLLSHMKANIQVDIGVHFHLVHWRKKLQDIMVY